MSHSFGPLVLETRQAQLNDQRRGNDLLREIINRDTALQVGKVRNGAVTLFVTAWDQQIV